MKEFFARLRKPGALAALWIAVCFALTSTAYLRWTERLIPIVGSPATDHLSMVAGYLFQAAGLGVVALWYRRRTPNDFVRPFALTLALFVATAAAAILAAGAPAVVAFGFGMNFFCGAIAGFYLYVAASRVRDGRRSLVFGCGYAISTLAVGLPALLSGWHPSDGEALFICGLLALVAYFLARRDAFPRSEIALKEREALSGNSLALAVGVVVLISAAKNLGFAFPSGDIESGLRPELSRIPYAISLAAAGFVNDRDHKAGMLCTVAALILPFLMLGLRAERLPNAVFWGLDYLFFGFFSVYRTALFLDLAARTGRRELAPLGLLAGRVGDAAGTGACLLLARSPIALILLCTLTFVPSVFLIFRLYHRLYEPEAPRQRSEQEAFDMFCLRHDLSSREREVLRSVLSGLSNGEIAQTLFITESTVKYHVRNVLQKTGCKNRAELQKSYMELLYPQADLRGIAQI